MSHTRLAILVTTLVALPLSIGSVVVVGPGSAAHAAGSPAANGSVYNIFLERDTATFDPAHAITGTGYWGHEDAGRAIGATVFSLDGRAGLDPINSAFQVTDPSTEIGVAFVPTSSDGTKERPTVQAGETAGQAFAWFTTAPCFGTIVGDRNADSVMMVSTHAQYVAWAAAGSPDELIENDLTVHDPQLPGDPASGAHAKGTSILNTWAAGTHVSLVYFAIDATKGHNGFDDNGEPIVKVGSDNRAITAWMPFVTRANPDRAIATSGGYDVVGAVKPLVTLSQAGSGDTDTLTATIKLPDGSSTATDATGTVQFAALPKNAASGTYAPVGAPVTVTNGVATMTISLAGSGLSTNDDIQKYEATYAPDNAANGSYLASDASQPLTVQGPAPATPSPSPSTTTPSPTASPTPTPTPSAYAAKLKKDEDALKTAKKALKKAKGAKKKKLKKKVATIQKAIKNDEQMIAAGHRSVTLG